jgi:hypothetical protein
VLVKRIYLRAQKLKSRVILYAPNSHVGGGGILLRGLIKNWPKGVAFQGYIDSRASEFLNLEKEANITWIEPTITSRLKAEISLSKVASSNDVVVFFNSLPPLFTFKGRVIVLLQNRNLVEKISLRSFKFKQALRISIERSWSYFFRSRVDEYIVQTESFKRAVTKWYKRKDATRDITITVFPFMDSDDLLNTSILERPVRQYDFIYVADGLAQKNHLALFNAWEVLAGEDVFPSLAITLPDTEMDLLNKVAELQKKGLKIINLGWLPHSELLLKYEVSGALIFPSLRESFGLPLVEASKLNVPILASELDYVYDVCEPAETFDPTSPRSIGRAVRRFLNISPSLRQVQDPADFANYIIHSAIDGDNFAKD